MATRVLVTGITGFLAQHIVLQLLAKGYQVRGTLRSKKRVDEVRTLLRKFDPRADEIEFVEADLSSDAGWSEAVKDCTYVQHIASPIPAVHPKDEMELIRPARDGALRVLKAAKAAGVKRIVALRGDLPATAMSTEAPGELRYANELVTFIRELHGDDFLLEVAAYPEMHPQAASPQADFDAYVRKVKAGAHGAVTQYFYNADCYFEFVERSHKAGISIPCVPGVMPIVNTAQLLRFSAACGAEIPRWVKLRLESYGDDKASVQAFGLEVVTRLSETLLKGGAPGLHFYTLNQAEPTLKLWRNLGLPS